MMIKATRIGAYNWLLEFVLLQKEDGIISKIMLENYFTYSLNLNSLLLLMYIMYSGSNYIHKLLNWPLLALSTIVQGEQRPSKALMKCKCI